MLMYEQKKPLLVWEPRFPPDEHRRIVEEQVASHMAEVQVLRAAREPLLGPQKGDPKPMLDRIDELIADYQEKLLRNARELFVLDHPDCVYTHGPQGWAILSDDDEMYVRMKYL